MEFKTVEGVSFAFKVLKNSDAQTKRIDVGEPYAQDSSRPSFHSILV